MGTLVTEAGALVRGPIRRFLEEQAFFNGVQFTEQKRFLSSTFLIKSDDVSIRSIAACIDDYLARTTNGSR